MVENSNIGKGSTINEATALEEEGVKYFMTTIQ